VFDPTEIILAFHSTMLGAYLLLPFDTFGSSPTFSVMAAMAPEWVWGSVILACGLGLLAAMWAGSVQWRLRILFPFAHLWLVVAVAIAFANWKSAGVISYIFFGIIYIATYLRLAAMNGK
jgi:hypothetical protein